MKPENRKKLPENKSLLEKDLAVLLVDDNKVNQFLGKKILSQLGISDVELASDGSTALEMIKAKYFDVLLTDIEMPNMSGYELCEAIRKLPAPQKQMIIIALTANVSGEEKDKALALGMNDYLIKPYSPQDLLAVLLSHVQTRKGILVEDFHKVAMQSSDPIANIYGLFNNNRKDTLDLLQMLRNQIPELMLTVKKGILASDWEQTFQASHKLKSTIKLFSDEHLTTLIFEISENAREKKSLEEIPNAFENFVIRSESILMLINKELESV